MFESDALFPSLARFKDLITTILKSTQPKHIIQIGVGDGTLTEKLLQYVEKTNGHLTCIDTYSWNDNAKNLIQSSSNGTWASHIKHAADLYIIDNDYNYYTVSQELQACWNLNQATHQPFLLLLRGTDWPFAHRDAYHNPAAIPKPFLQPHSWTQGLFPDCSETSEDGLLFDDMAIALSEDGEKNGVLKAVWDFMHDKPQLKRLNIPAFFGLSIIFSDDAPWSADIKNQVEHYQKNQHEILALEENRLNFIAEIIRREYKFSKMEMARQNQNFDTDAFCKIVQAQKLPDTDLGKVSIIIPTFNRPEMLRHAIQSAVNQRYKNIEIIVINDAGCNVKSIIAEFADPRIHYIQNTTNLGVSASRNIGIQHATGKYIAYLDDDDRFHSDHINVLVNALHLSGFKFAYTDTFHVIQDEQFVPVRRRRFQSRAVDRESILIRTPFYPICACHEKSCLDLSGGFDEELHRHEDWDLWIRLAMHFPFLHIPLSLSDYTTTMGQLKKMSSWNGFFLITALQVHHKYRSSVKGNDYIQQKQLEFRNTLRYSALMQLQVMNEEQVNQIQIQEALQKIMSLSEEFTPDDVKGALALQSES